MVTLTKEEAQQVLDALDSCEWYDDGGFGCPSYDYDKVFPARETLRARLAQPEPEPVAWMFPDDLQRFKTSETFAQAYSVECGSPSGNTVPLYTAPQQREWQGLTDEEIEQVRIETFAGFQKALNETGNAKRDPVTLCRAIEAKLREKNNA